MLARAMFAVGAAILVGLAAFAPPGAAAKSERQVLSAAVGTSVGRIKLAARPRIRNRALEDAVRCKLDPHPNASRFCGKW